MSSKLEILYGLRVLEFKLLPGDAWILFENQCLLAIYNNYSLKGAEKPDKIKLTGCLVNSVDEQQDLIILRFNNEFYLEIDMRTEAFNGPEALQLKVGQQSILIWN